MLGFKETHYLLAYDAFSKIRETSMTSESEKNSEYLLVLCFSYKNAKTTKDICGLYTLHKAFLSPSLFFLFKSNIFIVSFPIRLQCL